MQQIYKKKDEWYHPEIDYYEMLSKFRWTRTLLSDLMDDAGRKGEHHLPTGYPQHMVLLMHYSGAWEVQEGKEMTGYQQMFQFWNKQFNNALYDSLVKLKPRLILDVCAGDGMLGKILAERGLPVKSIDNYEWPFKQRYSTVERFDYKDALEIYKPDIVIGCWMPLATDWTPDFRATKSVKHYMVIGEIDACCGGNWDSQKGWKMKRQTEASYFALCRTDDLWFNETELNISEFGQHHSQVYLYSKLP